MKINSLSFAELINNKMYGENYDVINRVLCENCKSYVREHLRDTCLFAPTKFMSFECPNCSAPIEYYKFTSGEYQYICISCTFFDDGKNANLFL